MARAGLLGMQFYDPAKKVWGQAHMQVSAEFLFLFTFRTSFLPTSERRGRP